MYLHTIHAGIAYYTCCWYSVLFCASLTYTIYTHVYRGIGIGFFCRVCATAFGLIHTVQKETRRKKKLVRVRSEARSPKRAQCPVRVQWVPAAPLSGRVLFSWWNVNGMTTGPRLRLLALQTQQLNLLYVYSNLITNHLIPILFSLFIMVSLIAICVR